jgi:Glyoxalase/Bleomycin resistance protein/Dioxygenase superfamily
MLKRVDRVQIAVNDRASAEATATAVFGAELIRRDEVATLGAARSVMQAGTSLIEFLEAAGVGPVADFMSRWKGGLFAAGFSVADLEQAAARLDRAGVDYVRANGQLYLDERATCGMRTVLSPFHERSPVGAIRWIYEVTNVIADWRAAAERYARIFGLDQSRFVPITSAGFGYSGALTMFEPPERLDRIELSEITAPDRAMGRFHARRGDSLYMFYVETDDVEALAARLKARNARFESRREGFGEGLWIHPSGFCGVLVGVSRTNLAWRWSGAPERAAVRR